MYKKIYNLCKTLENLEVAKIMDETANGLIIFLDFTIMKKIDIQNQIVFHKATYDEYAIVIKKVFDFFFDNALEVNQMYETIRFDFGNNVSLVVY